MPIRSLKLIQLPTSFLFLLLIAFGEENYAQAKSQIKVQGNKIQTSITYCNLELPKRTKLANLSFNVLYRFEVNENGETINIRKLRDDFVGEDVVTSCVSDWKIIGMPKNTWFFAYFFWSHTHGWFRQTVSNTKFSQVMEIDGTGIDKIVVSQGGTADSIRRQQYNFNRHRKD